MTPLVILDRDGVINEDSEHYIRSADEWKPIPRALEAIALLSAAGCRVVVATNQAGVAKAIFSQSVLDEIHGKLMAHVAEAGGRIDRIFVCTHHPDERCGCRKPEPGMLLEACSEYGIAPSCVPFVGDSCRDIKAAVSAGCQPTLVLTGNGRETSSRSDLPEGIHIFEDLMDFAQTFLTSNRSVCERK